CALNAKKPLGCVKRLPQVGAPLGIEPEVGAIAEDAAEDKSGVCSYGATVTAKLVDMLSREASTFGQIGLADAERFHELLDENFSNGCGLSFCHQHGSFTCRSGCPNRD